MALDYIGQMLHNAVAEANTIEVRGRVDQVVGTIIHASVPEVKVGELCILQNPGSDWSLKAEVVGALMESFFEMVSSTWKYILKAVA